MNSLKVAALTAGFSTPSSRFRVRKLIPDLQTLGVYIEECHSIYGSYPPAGALNRLKWLPRVLFDSYQRVKLSTDFDLAIVQKPLISTLVTFELVMKKPFIFDIDDALHLGTRGWTLGQIAKKSAHIVCGNEFLAEYYSKFGGCTVIPTAVDVNYFLPSVMPKKSKDIFVIGWSGSSSGFKYLYEIQDAIKILMDWRDDIFLKIISNEEPIFTSIPKSRIIFEKWSSQNEVSAMYDFDVGIMPLANTDWERGKCSYKMLTYMSVGLPVVVSAVGMNIEVFNKGRAGFAVSNNEDWIFALKELYESATTRQMMGDTGRAIVCDHYSNEVIVPKLANVIRSII